MFVVDFPVYCTVFNCVLPFMFTICTFKVVLMESVLFVVDFYCSIINTTNYLIFLFLRSGNKTKALYSINQSNQPITVHCWT